MNYSSYRSGAMQLIVLCNPIIEATFVTENGALVQAKLTKVQLISHYITDGHPSLLSRFILVSNQTITIHWNRRIKNNQQLSSFNFNCLQATKGQRPILIMIIAIKLLLQWMQSTVDIRYYLFISLFCNRFPSWPALLIVIDSISTLLFKLSNYLTVVSTGWYCTLNQYKHYDCYYIERISLINLNISYWKYSISIQAFVNFRNQN